MTKKLIIKMKNKEEIEVSESAGHKIQKALDNVPPHIFITLSEHGNRQISTLNVADSFWRNETKKIEAPEEKYTDEDRKKTYEMLQKARAEDPIIQKILKRKKGE